MLHCSSAVGPLDIERDDDRLDELYKLQHELGLVKVCVRPDPADRTDRVYIEGDILFHPHSTQFEELESLRRKNRHRCWDDGRSIGREDL